MTRVLGMLGLARKAGALALGTEAVIEAIRKEKAKIVIVAADASKTTTEQVENKCKFYNVEYDVVPELTSQQLGSSLGRSVLSAVDILYDNFYNGYKKARNEADPMINRVIDIDLKEVDVYGSKQK